jgi:putative transposase
MLTVIDEFSRRCLAIVVARKLRSDDVLHCLAELFALHGPPEHIRSDNVLRREAGYPGRQQISIH